MKRNIGRTGITVNAIGLGAWPLSNLNRPSEAEAMKLILGAIEGGVDLIDTADAYCIDDSEFGHSENLIGKVISQLKNNNFIKIVTKVGRIRIGKKWKTNGRPEYIKIACEASLQRLRLETIKLYQLHQVDPLIPIEETMGAFKELQDEGKIEHVGLSNVNKVQLDRADNIVRIESIQNRCNPWHKTDIYSGLVNECKKRGITYFPWYPFGGEKDHKLCTSNRVLSKLSEKYNVSSYQILLSWLLNLGEHLILIPGATKSSSILDSLRATKLEIEPLDLKLVENI